MALILIVDDEKNLRLTLSEALQREGHTVLTAADGAETIDICARLSPDLILLDLILPDLNGIQLLKRIQRASGPPIIIMTAYGEVRSAVEAMKHQAYDYICKPFDLEELRLTLHRVLEEVRTRQEVERLHGVGEGEYRCGVFIRKSEAAKGLWQVVKRAAASSTRIVLLQGETGTGKELVAKALHYESARRAHPFVDLNCAAINETLFESELFGHERGAFTDAKGAKRGLCELAHQGTLFLDEIGEMAMGLQAKFLRFLEEWKFRRVGGVHDIQVDVRVVAASNRDLKELVAQGKFREDSWVDAGCRAAIRTVRLARKCATPQECRRLSGNDGNGRVHSADLPAARDRRSGGGSGSRCHGRAYRVCRTRDADRSCFPEVRNRRERRGWTTPEPGRGRTGPYRPSPQGGRRQQDRGGKGSGHLKADATNQTCVRLPA